MTLLLAACASGPTTVGVPRTVHWTVQSAGCEASLRGLSVVDERIAWCGGSDGTLLRTTDGGATWTARPVAGGEALDFRSIHALDADIVWVASAGSGGASRIYHTTDGGGNWTLQHTNLEAEGFFDAIAFWHDANGQQGLVVGDPVDGWLTILRTVDGGLNWIRVPADVQPPSPKGEYAFAASGTSIALAPPATAWIVTGGSVSRLLRSTDGGASWTASALPLGDGSEAAGAFSVATLDGVHGIAVGGDYTKPDLSAGHYARTTNGGRTWSAPGTDAAESPAGYRSCVAGVPGTANRVWITVGTSGADASFDGGVTWEPIGSEALNSIALASSGRMGFAVGPAGTILRLDFSD